MELGDERWVLYPDDDLTYLNCQKNSYIFCPHFAIYPHLPSP